jgi:DNA-binding XRE family transcriptional regulator
MDPRSDRRYGPHSLEDNDARHPLARWRLVKHVTQEQLAERAGIGRVTVARIEAGAEPRVGTALRLASALRLKVEDVWTVDGEPSRTLLAAEAQAQASAKRPTPTPGTS